MVGRILIVLCIVGYGHAYSQSIQSISVSVFNENIAFPFTRITPLHPGVECGLTFWEKEKKWNNQSANVNTGFYYHKKVENAIYLRGEYVFSPKIKNILSFDIPLSLGYMHTFYPGEMYTLNSDGEPEKVRQTGRPHLMGSFGIGIRLTKYKVQPFVREEMVVVTPFASTIPVIVHSYLKLGINIQINSNEK